MAFFELRQYRVRSGRMDEWVRLMEETIIPFQTAQGMAVIGSFRGESDDSLFFWVRRFESEAERERLYEAVYGSEFWKNEIAPQIPDFLDRERNVVTRVVPTARSSIQ